MNEKKTHGNAQHSLVLGYLERISSTVFADFPKQLTALARGKHGVYALYKGDRLYYVGLATNLRNRIKQHLNDKHSGKWNRFSLYLVKKAEHIKELESLILRIADPKGNCAKGRLPGADNLLTPLRSSILQEQNQQIEKLFGGNAIPKKPKVTKARPTKIRPVKNGTGREPALAQYVTKRFPIQGDHQGTVHKAKILANGQIRYNGILYNSPSIAGAAAVNRKTCNGWTFWKYKDSSGTWVRLNELRK